MTSSHLSAAPAPDRGAEPSDAPARPDCWVVTDGKAGMELQCRGLAEALGLAHEIRRIQVTKPWRWLPPAWVTAPLARLGPKGDRLAPPFPRVLIASGRQTVASAMAIRRAGATFVIQIQNPVVDPAAFDLVVTPRHDRLRAPNVIATLGAMNLVTDRRLAAAAAQWRARFADLPRPLVAVLLGGDNKVYRLTPTRMRRLALQLRALCEREGAGLAITPSRRTGAANMAVLREVLADVPAMIWDGAGDNPYFGMLALADAIVVTADSVNMVSEAAGSGKPVLVAPLDGGSGKFRRFHAAMEQAGYTRPFDGTLPRWRGRALRETEAVAARIRPLIAAWESQQDRPDAGLLKAVKARK